MSVTSLAEDHAMPMILNRPLGALLLFALAPLLLVTTLVVLVAMGRPVLFVQTRSGQGKRPFGLVKFRTMTNHLDARGVLLPDAERTPAIGRLLRRTRLDDLLGLINVVAGDMAIVGPRPLLPATIAAIGTAGDRRAIVLPGITGWAQVNGNSLLTDDEKVALDLWYVDHRNWRLDLRVVARTLGVLVRGERLVGRPETT